MPCDTGRIGTQQVVAQFMAMRRHYDQVSPQFLGRHDDLLIHPAMFDHVLGRNIIRQILADKAMEALVGFCDGFLGCLTSAPMEQTSRIS